MAKQVYIIPFECVEHLMEDETFGFTDVDKVKRIGAKCGNILSINQFQSQVNKGEVPFDPEQDVILFD